MRNGQDIGCLEFIGGGWWGGGVVGGFRCITEFSLAEAEAVTIGTLRLGLSFH